MRLLIAGAPGSGKGTQSRRVSGALRIPHVSTGDLLRDAIRLGTPLGYGASECVAEGRLVPDALVNELVQARLGRAAVRARGFLLDGFPRNLDQLDALLLWLVPDGLDAAIELAVPNEVAHNGSRREDGPMTPHPSFASDSKRSSARQRHCCVASTSKDSSFRLTPTARSTRSPTRCSIRSASTADRLQRSTCPPTSANTAHTPTRQAAEHRDGHQKAATEKQ
jgi:adenylate kinase family enzyme